MSDTPQENPPAPEETGEATDNQILNPLIGGAINDTTKILEPADRDARYFSQRTFIPSVLGLDIVKAFRIARDPGGGVWYEVEGVYRPNGENVIKSAVRYALGDQFRAARLHNVLSWIGTLPTEISKEQARDWLIQEWRARR